MYIQRSKIKKTEAGRESTKRIKSTNRKIPIHIPITLIKKATKNTKADTKKLAKYKS